MNSFAPVGSVGRAFRILQILNSSGPVRVGEIAMRSDLPKPTVVRLIETLVSLGFVQKECVSKTYFVTPAVRSLSAGADRPEIIAQTSLPAIWKLTEELKWPAAVATLDSCRVFVCATTRNESKYALYYSYRQTHLSLTSHALGRALLAFRDPQDCDALIAELLKKKSAKAQAYERRKIERMLDRVRYCGFAERDRTLEPRGTSTLAVPIMFEGRAFASLGMTYFTSAVPREKLILQLVPSLEKVAAHISDCVAERSVL